MLKQRVAAAAVFAPVMLALVAGGGAPLLVAVALLVALMLGEACLLTGLRLASPLGITTLALGGATMVVVLGHGPGWLAAALLPALAVGPAAAALWAGPPWPARVAQVGLATWAALWCGALLPHLIRVRELPGVGRAAAILVLLSVWAADTGAYFVGRRFGRRRLAPTASPGKTLEGAAGGVVAALLAGLAVAAWAPEVLPWRRAASIAVLCAICGTVGDIAESVVKRSVGAKDSSRLIPGHGGVLDRFDALMFAAPAADAWLRWGP